MNFELYETNVVQRGCPFPALANDAGTHLISCKNSATQCTKVKDSGSYFMEKERESRQRMVRLIIKIH